MPGTMAAAVAVVAYLDNPSLETIDAALEATSQPVHDDLGHYLNAFIKREKGWSDLEVEILKTHVPGRESTYKYFFVYQRDGLAPLLKMQLTEFCYLHRVNSQRRAQLPPPPPGQAPPDFSRCPIHGVEYETVATERQNEAGLRCPVCDPIREAEDVPGMWPVFQQICWASHGADRIAGWQKARDRVITPEQLFDELGFKEGQRIADIGGGEGYFTIPFARKVGPSGHVFLEEIDPHYLEFVEYRAQAEGLGNVTGVLGGPGDVKLPAGSVDAVFVCEVYRHICTNATRDDPEVLENSVKPFNASLHRALVDGGTLVFIEHDLPLTKLEQISPSVLIEQVEAAGFKLTRESDMYAPLQKVMFFEKI